MMMMSSQNNLLWFIAYTRPLSNDKLLAAILLIYIIIGQAFFILSLLQTIKSWIYAAEKYYYRVNVNAWNRQRQPISFIMIRRMATISRFYESRNSFRSQSVSTAPECTKKTNINFIAIRILFCRRTTEKNTLSSCRSLVFTFSRFLFTHNHGAAESLLFLLYCRQSIYVHHKISSYGYTFLWKCSFWKMHLLIEIWIAINAF